MIRFIEPTLAAPVDCPYLTGQEFTQEYFFALGLSRRDLGELLEQGWRRFGTFFFRPKCRNCQACTPLRLDAGNLNPSSSQRKAWKKNSGTEVVVKDLEFRPELFEVYADHSRHRFGKEESLSQFQETFFSGDVPAIQTEYYINGQLAGLGFCDIGHNGLSSVYFVFREEFSSYSLGVFSVIKECEIAKEMGLSYYYLGYWVKGNDRMAYKATYSPKELMSWDTYKWNRC